MWLLITLSLLSSSCVLPPAPTPDLSPVFGVLCTYGRDVGELVNAARDEAGKYAINLIPVHLSDEAPQAETFETWAQDGCDIGLVRRDMGVAQAIFSVLFWGRRGETWMPTSKYKAVILVYDGDPETVRHELLHALGCDHSEDCERHVRWWRVKHGQPKEGA